MTLKQTILKFVYPLFRKYSHKKSNNSGVQINAGHAAAITSFYSLQGTLIDKTIFDFNNLKGKKVLLVNLASNCGFTPQYQELEKLNQLYTPNLQVLGFPANDFKSQEPGTDDQIEEFCRRNYGVSFHLFTKASVLKPGQQQVFEWLSSKEKNGWNDQPPSWNFCKYLVDENGNLLYIFKPSISPLNVVVINAIEAPVGFKELTSA